MANHIVVVGSINMDLVIEAPRNPNPGETILGSRFSTFSGGKGANQAVAAARLGAEVRMIGCVGQDQFGSTLVNALKKESIDTTNIFEMSDAATGVAAITVAANGQNSIVVAPGANARVTPELVRKCEGVFKGAAVVLLQLEVPLDSVEVAVELGRLYGAKVVLNPAPAQKLSPRLVSLVDDLIPNQSELELIAGESSQLQAVRKLHTTGARRVIVTMGGDGALLSETGREQIALPAFSVPVVDTTAAGDAFIGGYGVALSEGRQPAEAMKWGLAAGSLAVTKLGAQSSLPTRSEVEKLLKTQSAK